MIYIYVWKFSRQIFFPSLFLQNAFIVPQGGIYEWHEGKVFKGILNKDLNDNMYLLFLFVSGV